ncbi:MAG: methyltransferase domain-containing protein [Acidobacteriaceae bacterium]|nr:methyltransferase domain-containing protein [Acidobacteriaceae bacterium]
MKHVRCGANIIDYGGGSGGTARQLRESGYDVQVADVAPEVLSTCRRTGLSAIDLNVQQLPSNAADCVLACDVLEHVENERELLSRFRDALRVGGILIVTVPAFEFLWSGEDFISSHRRRHTRRSIVRNIDDSGYTVLWSSYFNTLLFPIVSTAIILTRLLRPREMYRSNVKRLPSWQNHLLYNVFSFERRLLQSISFPVGVSIAVVAKRADAQ